METLLRWYLARANEDAVLRIVFGEDAARLPDLVSAAIADAQPVVDDLIARDVADGALRPDFDFADFRAVCAAVTATMNAGPSEAAWTRVLDFVLAGIRTPDSATDRA